MRTEKKAGKEPLLYINQPRLDEVKGNMQVTYRTPKKQKPQIQPENKHSLTTNKPTAPEEQLDRREEKYLDEEVHIHHTDGLEVSEVNEAHSVSQPPERKTAASTFRKLRPFRELSIDEKLDYISASINGKVPFPCEFSDGHQSVKGVILQDDEDHITIRSFQGKEVEMKKNEVRSIKMIGLQ
ncbi:spore coat CotO family protein [Rossellomorea aquimaris]|uniref:CotO family spore coat protein n=1 Tax=Rossellomorea aquimaris TaxID=189382 RepID=UPI001CD433AF|nr:CotO family spore coat protein [Rossellomorea aquimaris]MCA1059467.1 spore coat CotO family protein [Rossellomorea aquimaris]